MTPPAIARGHGVQYGPTLADWGEETDREDCTIGTTARLAGEPVSTRTQAHVDQIDGLEIGTC